MIKLKLIELLLLFHSLSPSLPHSPLSQSRLTYSLTHSSSLSPYHSPMLPTLKNRNTLTVSTMAPTILATVMKRNIFTDMLVSSSTACESSWSMQSTSVIRECGDKLLKFESIEIDSKNDIEQRIHEWLDKEDVRISDPAEKLANYFHSAR